MANKGLAGVKVEVLARQLKVSKGSFYWHFKNRQEILEAILQRWENETMWLIEESQKAGTSKESLVKLFTLTKEICNLPDPEPAIVLWANQDSKVQNRVRIVENKRVDYVAKLLQKYGFDETESRHRAEVAYFSLLGFLERKDRDRQFNLSMKEFNDFLLTLLLSPLAESERDRQ